MIIIPKGTKIHVGLETGFVGMQDRSNYILTRDFTEDELNNELWLMAKDFAEGYGLYPECEYNDEEILEDEDSYVDSIEGWWVYYDEELHRGYTYSGCPEFNEL